MIVIAIKIKVARTGKGTMATHPDGPKILYLIANLHRPRENERSTL